MTERWKIARRLLLAVLVLVVVLFGAGVVPLNLGVFSGLISRITQDLTGLRLEVAGSLTLRLGAHPQMDAESITLADARASDKVLASIETLSVRPRLLAMLGGEYRVDELTADGVSVDYCAELPAGAATQTESSASEPGDVSPVRLAIESLAIDAVSLQCRSETMSAPDVSYGRLEASLPVTGPTNVTFSGLLDQLPLGIEISTGNLNALLGNAATVPLIMRASKRRGVVDRQLSLAWHRSLSRASASPPRRHVTTCKPCSRFNVYTMSPVCTLSASS